MQVQCPKHKGSEFLYILQKEKEVEFICDQCHTNLIDNKKLDDNQNLINIKRAFLYPEYLFSKIIDSQKLQQFFQQLIEYDEQNLDNQLISIENQIKEVQRQISLMHQELEFNKKKFVQLRQQIRENLEEIIKFDEFKSYIVNLNNLQKSIDPQDIKQSERDVYIYFQNQFKNKSSIVNNQVFTLLEYKNEYMKPSTFMYPELKKLENQYQQLKEMHSSYDKIINPQFPGIIQNTKLITKEFQAKLIDTIVEKSKKPIMKIELIHNESRTNLSTEQFWNIVDGKSNLLMVFQSQSEFVFGAYTPCKWVKSKKGQYVNDETLSSFIFSQTNFKIYPIKQEGSGCAIYCCTSYGPIFGGTSLFNGSIINYFSNKSHLMILTDLKNGSSSLGISYEDEDLTHIKGQTLLFGQIEPKIIMYEISQLSFI
ncbi:unnamed protein product (macronuclear) [Paramecium tetraurelia]|uniref:TLDc domain-containing protein n=1 Tax=Paramecium tetraurelia TaxID=5888 RepID=A0E320_PARTE|nr:uncharacterized protein GSPATT00022860001 [Paramecium tetraurelia]CAK89687.1 unnamed protein product [Paramecium tetraurelia]|eukprot:XP_001457084.1 hypothetical protein (macronuclear) [Paramecium tetraurelia strain d4-2]